MSFKLTNPYVTAMGDDLYADIPKAVLAAVAVSILTIGGDHLDQARDGVIREWQALSNAGIVPQRPPVRYVAELPKEES